MTIARSKLTAQGQISVPAEVRRRLGVVPGSVSHLALAETVWVLDAVYERTRADVARAIELLLNHRELSLQEPDVVAAALERFRSRRSIGFSDCLLLESHGEPDTCRSGRSIVSLAESTAPNDCSSDRVHEPV